MLASCIGIHYMFITISAAIGQDEGVNYSEGEGVVNVLNVLNVLNASLPLNHPPTCKAQNLTIV